MTNPDHATPDVLRRVARGWDTPPAPTWLATSLTADYQRRRGRLGPKRELALAVVEDSRRGVLVGVRAGRVEPAGFTLVLRTEEPDDAPIDVVVDVLPLADGLAVDGLVLRQGGTDRAFRATATAPDGEIVEAVTTDVHGRFSLRGLRAVDQDLLLDDGHDALRGAVPLGAGP